MDAKIVEQLRLLNPFDPGHAAGGYLTDYDIASPISLPTRG
jgi:hypothetical protein